MNRTRRRIKGQRENQSGLENVPIATICESIMLLVKELRRRGVGIFDFDNKRKSLQEIKIFDKVYFFAAEDENEKR